MHAIARMLAIGSIICVPTAFASVAAAAPLLLDRTTIKALDAAASLGIRQGNTVGVAVEIMSDGKVVYRRAYGSANLETATPMTADSVFRIASITKQFTAAAILILSERGQIGLEDRLSKYLPSFPNAERITIRQLLTHTSGLKDYTDDPEYWTNRSRIETSTDDFVKYIATLQPQFEFDPGTKWNYSNSGYYLLGAVIEHVTGGSLATFFKKELFDRVGMKDTAVDSAEDIVRRRASGYEHSPTTHQLENAPYISLSTVGANGSIRSTVDDLARWHYALLSGKIIRPASLKEMLSPGRLSNGQLASTARLSDASSPPDPKAKREPPLDYGFGMDLGAIDGLPIITHQGGINGFRSELTTFTRQKVTVVFFCNTGEGVADAPTALNNVVARYLARH